MSRVNDIIDAYAEKQWTQNRSLGDPVFTFNRSDSQSL